MRTWIKIFGIIGLWIVAIPSLAAAGDEGHDREHDQEESAEETAISGSDEPERSSGEVSLSSDEKADGDGRYERGKDREDGLEDGEVHERRMAQLRRLRDLAVENDRRDMISRVDGLIARELKRFAREVAIVAEADAAEDKGDNENASPAGEGTSAESFVAER